MLATGGDRCLSTGYLLSLASSITNAIQVEGIRPSPRLTLPHRGLDNSRQCVLHEKYNRDIKGREMSVFRFVRTVKWIQRGGPSLRWNLVLLISARYIRRRITSSFDYDSIVKYIVRIIIIANKKFKLSCRVNKCLIRIAIRHLFPSSPFPQEKEKRKKEGISKIRYQFSFNRILPRNGN